MCGIVGAISAKMVKSEINAFADLLHVDQVRGPHSTGLTAIVGDKGHTFKRAVPASDFLQLKAANNLLALTFNATAYIGHNRWATRGAVTDENAHPFIADNITMVHNGTITNQWNLDKNAASVDSEAIANYLAENGGKATAEKVEGKFALVWHDASDNTMNFVRNEERPLFVAVTETAIFWASEHEMLKWALSRNNLKIKYSGPLPIGYILSLPADGSVVPKDSKEMSEHIEKVDLVPKRVYTGYQGNGAGSGGNGNYYNQNGYRYDDPASLYAIDEVVTAEVLEWNDITHTFTCRDVDTLETVKIRRPLSMELRKGDIISSRIQSNRGQFAYLSMMSNDVVKYNPQSRVYSIDGVYISSIKYRELKKTPCVFCNNIFTDNDMLTARLLSKDKDITDPIHGECWVELEADKAAV